MKKFFVFAATLAAVLFTVSCEKEDVIATSNVAMDNEIKVTAMIAAPATKAGEKYNTPATDTKEADVTSFKMHMWSGDNKIADGTKFVKPVSPWTYWNDGNVRYWNADKTYTFVGTIVDNESADITGATVTKGQVKIENYEVKVPAMGIGTDPTGMGTDGQSQEDPCVAITTGSQSSKTTAMTFYHVLSRVQVAVKATIDSKYKLQAKFLGFELQGVSTKGTTTITNASSISWTSAATGSVRDNRWKYNNAGAVDITNATSFKTLNDNSWCNVIPGTNVATTLVAKVAFYDEKGDYIETRYFKATGSDLVNGSDLGTTPTYKAGYRYTYNVTIKNDGGPSSNPTDPTDPTDPNYPNKPGDDPLSNFEIKIESITVTAWTSKTGGTAEFKNS